LGEYDLEHTGQQFNDKGLGGLIRSNVLISQTAYYLNAEPALPVAPRKKSLGQNNDVRNFEKCFKLFFAI
jgi:hypothetical protein